MVVDNKVMAYLDEQFSSKKSVRDMVYNDVNLPLLIGSDEEAVISLYARVSTTKSQQKSAVEAQTSMLERWLDEQCRLHPNWHKGKTYVDAHTGRSFSTRKEYNRMMRDVKAGGVTYIVFWETSRFGRNLSAVLKECIKINDDYGVDLYFIDKEIDTRTPDGLGKLAIEAQKADEASLQTKARVDRGIAEKTAVLEAMGDGYLHTTRALGLIAHDGEKQKLFRVEEEVETLNIMANYYLECKSLTKTAKHLIEQKRLTVQGGTYWDASTVFRCLHNTIYVCIEEQNKTRINYGDNYYNGTRTNIDKSEHKFVYLPHRIERIWDDEFFLKIQETLNGNRREWNSGTISKESKSNGYKDLIWCDCGGRYNLHSKSIAYGKNWYECHHQKHKGSKNYIEASGQDKSLICERSCIQDWKLDMMMHEIITELKFTKETIADEMVNIISESYVEDCPAKNELEEIEDIIKDIKKQLSNARQLLYKGIISDEEYKSDTESLKLELLEAEQKQEMLNIEIAKSESVSIEDIQGLQQQLIEKIDTVIKLDKNKYLFNMIYMIVHTSDNEYTWVLNLFEDNRDVAIPQEHLMIFTQRVQNRVKEVYVDKRNLLAEFEINEQTARAFKKTSGLGPLKKYETIKVKVYY